MYGPMPGFMYDPYPGTPSCPWALMGQALIGWALMGPLWVPWAFMGRALLWAGPLRLPLGSSGPPREPASPGLWVPGTPIAPRPFTPIYIYIRNYALAIASASCSA